MNEEKDQLRDLLEKVQLGHFYLILRDQLQISLVSHFNHVKPKDLERVGMAKPAIRRLLDAVERYKPGPTRSPPLPPTDALSKTACLNRANGSKKPTATENKGAFNLTKIISLNFDRNKPKSISIEENQESYAVSKPVAFLINANDLEIIKSAIGGEEILGSGQFGVVKKAVWNTHTGQKIMVAVKCLHNNNISKSNDNRQTGFSEIFNEVTSMCGLEHKHLIKLYGIVLNLNSIVMMVTEYAPYGSLQNYLRNVVKRNNVNIPVKQIYSYVYQIAVGMDYLERKRLVHRDLAARNILLYTLEHVKICDFGMTRSVHNFDDGSYPVSGEQKIPCAWYPPEAIRERRFSIKSDVWAFGVAVWEIFTCCEQPWPGMSAAQILNKIEVERARLSQPYLCSRNFYKFLLKCWSSEPDARPSFENLKSMIKGKM